jgi:hypothetical protein
MCINLFLIVEGDMWEGFLKFKKSALLGAYGMFNWAKVLSIGGKQIPLEDENWLQY